MSVSTVNKKAIGQINARMNVKKESLEKIIDVNEVVVIVAHLLALIQKVALDLDPVHLDLVLGQNLILDLEVGHPKRQQTKKQIENKVNNKSKRILMYFLKSL